MMSDSDAAQAQQPTKPEFTSKLLTASEIAQYYPAIRECCLFSLPEEDRTEEAATNVMGLVTAGKMLCWGIIESADDKFRGCLFGYFTSDVVLKKTILVLYGLHARGNYIPPERLLSGWSGVEQFAKSQNCTSIAFICDKPENINLARALGFTKTYTSMSKGL